MWAQQNLYAASEHSALTGCVNMKPQYRYTFPALCERFGISADDVVRFIELEILVPDKWVSFSAGEKASYIKEDFRYASWTADEVDRFASITDLFRKNYQLFYQRIGMRLDTIESKNDSGFETLISYSKKMMLELADLKQHVDHKDTWIDSQYFCRETGYKISSFHNRMESWFDDNTEKGRVYLGNYKSLEWVRPRGEKKWKCRLVDFEKIRSGFSYDMRLEEKKRKGEFKGKLQINITDIV